MPTASDNTNCTGCGSAGVATFFRMPDAPINCGRTPRSQDDALRAARGEIRLGYCPECGLVFNETFDVGLIDFEPGYEVSLDHSRVFRDFQTGVIEHLYATYNLENKRILEIGCGEGTFLKRLCQRGGNIGVGVDPTVPAAGQIDTAPGTAKFVRDFFSEAHGGEIGDLVCSLSMFEDVPAPLEFLQMLRRTIGNRQPGIYFEVFNGFRSIESGEIWSIHYEQCNYFSLQTLEALFRKTGFRIANSGYCYQGDQYLFVEARPDPGFDFSSPAGEPVPPQPGMAAPGIPPVIRNFSRNFCERVDYWQTRLERCRQDQQRVALWGSGGKGITFLNAIANPEMVDAVIDINPNRQGTFIPGTGHAIVAPETLCQHPPDVIVLTNPIYEQEIRSQAAGLGFQAEYDFV